jgi:hypothetical protein
VVKTFQKASLGLAKPSVSTPRAFHKDLNDSTFSFEELLDSHRQLRVGLSACSSNEKGTQGLSKPPKKWEPFEVFRSCDRGEFHLQFWN